MTSAFERAHSKPSPKVVTLALAGWIVAVTVATWIAVRTGSPLTRFGPLTGLPRPPILTVAVAAGYWVCFVLVRWWRLSRRS
jgi:hypothetical protein